MPRIGTTTVMMLLLLGLCSAPSHAEEEAYRLASGDVLEISVWRDETLSRELIVPPDGVISFPLIGDTKAAGKTVAELRQIITAEVSDYVPDPSVTVILVRATSLVAYVLGKVNKPGVFPIALDTNVMRVLSMAGGLTPFASAGNIVILRQEEGKSLKLPFDYKEVEKGGKLDQNIALKRGDVVVVP